MDLSAKYHEPLSEEFGGVFMPGPGSAMNARLQIMHAASPSVCYMVALPGGNAMKSSLAFLLLKVLRRCILQSDDGHV